MAARSTSTMALSPIGEPYERGRWRSKLRRRLLYCLTYRSSAKAATYNSRSHATPGARTAREMPSCRNEGLPFRHDSRMHPSASRCGRRPIALKCSIASATQKVAARLPASRNHESQQRRLSRRELDALKFGKLPLLGGPVGNRELNLNLHQRPGIKCAAIGLRARYRTPCVFAFSAGGTVVG